MKKLSLLIFPDQGRFPRPLIITALLTLMAVTFGQAQSVVKGTVTDENGSSMPGVNVIIKNTTNGTTTDGNGTYSINVPGSDAILVFSFIGYNTLEEPVNSRTSIDVKLAPNIQALQEVVVVGYGTQKKSDVTGSLVSVNSETLKEVPAANLQQALQGRAAGLEVQRIGTAPGAGARIRIRGERSISGSNDPLIVLDGIPFEGGSLSDINQDEIASIDILKDASATAIYGSRGANGVILITTKRGKAGDTRLSFDSYYGVTTVARKYDMFSAEEYTAYRDTSPYNQGYMPEEVESMAIGRTTNWQDLMYKAGYITNHNINVSGGSENSSFSVGGGYFKETTVLPGQDFQRYSLRATIDTKIGKKLKIGLNTMNSVNITNGSQFINQQPNTSGFSNSPFGGSIMFQILSMSPLMPAYNEDGSINIKPAGNVDDQAAQYSPLLLKKNEDQWVDRQRRIRTFNSVFAEYQIIEGLKYRFNLGLDYRQQEFAQFQGTDSYNRPASVGPNRARVNNGEGWGYTMENIVTYEKTFADKHRLGVTALYSRQADQAHNTIVTKDEILADFIQYYDLGQGNPALAPVLGGNESSWGLISLMARVNYAYDNRYMLTITGRRDGSSRLAEKWHEYPAVAVGWNVMNESFMSDISAVTNLKLRVGYGETSNQAVSPYSTLGGVSAYLTNGGAQVPIRYNYGLNEKEVGYSVVRVPDKTLDWEYTSTINVGLDFGVLENRITGTIDWYKAHTNNLLFGVNLPSSSGVAGNFETNVGEMENKGLEIAISADIFRSAEPGGFSWSADLNWFYNRNELVKLNGSVKRVIGSGLHVGHSLNAIYDYDKIGIWQADEAAEAAVFGQLPGQLKLRDISGPDGVPDGQITPEYDRKIIADGQAKWQGGITNRFTFKNFDLNFVTYIRYGGTLISGLHMPSAAYLTIMDGRRNQLDVDYWTPENPSNWFPMPSAQIAPSTASTAWSTLGYYDATFVKVRSITLGYTLPGAIAQRIYSRSARVYFTVQNPFLLFSPYVNKYNGVDPEATGIGTTGFVGSPGNLRGGDNGALVIAASTPPTRSFIFGLNISF